MNRGVLERSPVQQITAAGNPNWWSITPSATRSPPSTHHHNHQFQLPPPLPTNNFHLFQPPQTYQQYSSPCNWALNHDDYGANPTHQDQITTSSWSQLFVSGLVGDEEKELMNHFHENQQAMAMEDHIKQENSSCGFVYANNEETFQVCNKSNTTTSTNTTTNCWSPQSCITTIAKPDPPPAMLDRNSECNSSAVVNGGTNKKAKVQSSTTQSTFKVRKFGDRITALHQLVSPFGKTDTASVLLEAIGYIRFLQSQIEALSIPYMGTGSGNNKRQQHPQFPQSVQGERNCIFPEDPGQLLNDNCLKRKGGPDQEEPRKDLRSRGLCLVPVSCTLHVGRDNGADYWAPMLGGFR